MNISSLLTNIYENILKYNNTEIIVLFDDTNTIWFSYNHILQAIGYNDTKTQKKRLAIDNIYFDTYNNIYKTTSLNKYNEPNLQNHTKMINESGLYLLLSKSNKKLAKDLLKKMVIDILPSLRKTGKYILNSEEKNKMKKLTKQVLNFKKEASLKQKTKYSNLSGKGFIYIIKIKTLKDGKEEQCYKIGYTANLEKRINTYKTGNPDIELVHHENVNVSKKQLEKCVLNLNILQRLSSKNEIICNSSLDEIKNEIKDCKKLIKKYIN